MSSNPQNPSRTPPAFEFKSGSITTPVLHLFKTEMSIIREQLHEKVSQSPQFFTHSPLLIDLENTSEDDLNLTLLIETIRDNDMIPVGIRGGTEAQKANAKKLGLSVMSGVRNLSKPLEIQIEQPPEIIVEPEITIELEQTEAPKAPPAEEIKAEAQPQIEGSTVINHVVRSGQQIYAKGDLIILSSVGAGAEVISEGNIHIYGTLRGRALAGVLGDETARIFCSDLQAELISIAGNFRINEDLDKKLTNTPVKIHLHNQALIIEKI